MLCGLSGERDVRQYIQTVPKLSEKFRAAQALISVNAILQYQDAFQELNPLRFKLHFFETVEWNHDFPQTDNVLDGHTFRHCVECLYQIQM